ncbi:MAG: hypothetical protein RLZZ360_454 [Candidatus Parcubacteria bacterium]|jgi:UDP-glucose 4-epimerase
MSKLIVVTGGAGFVGSHLCERLVQEGHQVISLDNYFTGSVSNHVAGVTYRTGHTKDIAKHIPEAPDMVFHLGEYARVEQSFADVATVLDFNQQGTAAVLEFVRQKNPKLIYAGSSTKFADGGMGRDQSPYAWTKASNTDLVRRYGEWFGISYAITYFYNVYGPRERSDANSGTVIGIFKDRYIHGLSLPVRRPGTQKRNFTHVFDIIEGLVRVGEHGEGDEYGLGHELSYSIEAVAQLFGAPIEWLEERPGNRMYSEADTRRSRLELGWQATHLLSDYIKTIVDQHEAHTHL